jgi:hypothetical protein
MCWSVNPLRGEPPTGEPDAAEPPVRFGGRGTLIGSPYPYRPDTLAKAKAAYQDFLTLGKDADPDIPILKQAQAEYAKLQ